MNPNVRPETMARITTPELANAFIEEQIAAVRAQVGDKKVLLALSGGVDSSVVAALLIKAIGKQPEFADDARNIADAVAIAVAERARVNLVDDRVLIRFAHDHILRMVILYKYYNMENHERQAPCKNPNVRTGNFPNLFTFA